MTHSWHQADTDFPEQSDRRLDPATDLATSPLDAPRTGGFASDLPEDAAYAVEVCREQDSLVSCRVPLRLEPEHDPAPKRPPRR